MSFMRRITDPGGHGAMRDVGLLVLRLGFGLTIALAHGWGKMAGFTENSGGFPDPLGIGSEASMALAIFAELVCGLLVAVGLFGRLATVPLIIMLLVAFFIVHGSDPFGDKELALTYLAGFLGLFFTGPGRYSVDAMIGRR